MPAHRIELSRRRFGALKVVEFDAIRNKSAYWWCVCDCAPGERISVKATRLIAGKAEHCGCLGYRRDPERHKIARGKVPARKRRAIAKLGQLAWQARGDK